MAKYASVLFKSFFATLGEGSDFVRKVALSFVTAVKSSMMMRVIYMMSSGDE